VGNLPTSIEATKKRGMIEWECEPLSGISISLSMKIGMETEKGGKRKSRSTINNTEKKVAALSSCWKDSSKWSETKGDV